MVKQRHASINLKEPELVIRTIHHAIEKARAQSCGSRIAIGTVRSSTVVEMTPNDRSNRLFIQVQPESLKEVVFWEAAPEWPL
jgi:hypothetical protein